MLGSERLRARLAELVRVRRTGAGHDVKHSVPLGDSATPTGIEDYLPGGEWRDEGGAVYVHERLRSAVEERERHWGSLGTPPEEEEDLADLAGRGLERALFLDLETGGLASSPVFLAGTMHWNGSDFVLRQYFARHYGEEGPLLRALAGQMRGFDTLVTFNGKSYDVPFLLARSVIHGARPSIPERHVDLLHPARRRWKELLPDCRLQTLEFHVCRRRRIGDVPGEEVPALYHDYIRRGDPYRLVPVFHHNLLDVITMAEVLRSLCTPRPEAQESQGELGMPEARESLAAPEIPEERSIWRDPTAIDAPAEGF